MKSPPRAVVACRGLRGFADGLVSVLLAGYLSGIGFSSFEIGSIVAGTLLGSAALTGAVGLLGDRLNRRRLLLGAAGLMCATGLAFVGLRGFWPLLLVAVLGTLNPSASDVSVFLPAEQAVLADATSGPARTAIFARYNVVGSFAAALGAWAAALPALAAPALHIATTAAERSGFFLYAAVALVIAAIYRRLPERKLATSPPTRTLDRSRRIVLRLALLFSLDSFGGGFVVQSLLVLWLHQRFELSMTAMGTVFFAAGLVGALSQFFSARLAARFGHIETMVFTHLPANLFLIAAGLAPSAPIAIVFLLLRAALSQMDVPARQAYVMAVVPPEERAAAASFTNVPRSLAAATPPLLAGLMLEWSSFGWPLIVGGAIKALYDLLLLRQFRGLRPAADA